MIINNNAIKYTNKIDNPLALFDIIFNFTFFNASSIFLHGTYSKYAIKIPTKNGLIIPKNVPILFVILPKLSNVL